MSDAELEEKREIYLVSRGWSGCGGNWSRNDGKLVSEEKAERLQLRNDALCFAYMLENVEKVGADSKGVIGGMLFCLVAGSLGELLQDEAFLGSLQEQAKGDENLRQVVEALVGAVRKAG